VSALIVNIDCSLSRKRNGNKSIDYLPPGDNVQAVENLGLRGPDAALHKIKTFLQGAQRRYLDIGTEAFER
jgi:hypothetical protein